jgi:excisionase family DNA binding protein
MTTLEQYKWGGSANIDAARLEELRAEEELMAHYEELELEHARKLLGVRNRAPKAVPLGRLLGISRGHLTVAHAAARLSVSEKTVRELIRAGELPFIDIGVGRVRAAPRITIEDIEAFEEKRRGRKQWRLAKEEKSITTSSSSEVLDFAALRAARRSAKPKSSSAKGGRKRQKRTNIVKL